MTIHAILVADDDRDVEEQTGLRLTVHVPINECQLQQVVDYVGDERGGRTAGRVFAMQSGIAGHVYRVGRPLAAQRFEEDYERHVRDLLWDWAYVEEDARKLDPATRAWMAVPLVVPPAAKIQGILYLDSRDRDYFTADRQRLVINAATGVARFVTRRYSNNQEPS